MPELLTHVLAAYALATALSFRYSWITPGYVTIAMIGGMIPDLNRLELLAPAEVVESVVGIPWDWGAVHTFGGSAVVVAVGSLLVPPAYRRRVLAMLALGVVSHLLLDALLINASGHSYALLWPLTGYHPPTPGLFLSSDRWPAVITGGIAAAVWAVRYRIGDGNDD